MRRGEVGHRVSWLATRVRVCVCAVRRGCVCASPSLSELMLLDVAPPGNPKKDRLFIFLSKLYRN